MHESEKQEHFFNGISDFECWTNQVFRWHNFKHQQAIYYASLFPVAKHTQFESNLAEKYHKSAFPHTMSMGLQKNILLTRSTKLDTSESWHDKKPQLTELELKMVPWRVA